MKHIQNLLKQAGKSFQKICIQPDILVWAKLNIQNLNMKNKNKMKENKTYTITLTTKFEANSKEEARKIAEEKFKESVVEKVESNYTRRSNAQNRSLHLWLEMLEAECERNGITLDMIIKKPQDLPVTRHILKDLFRFVGKRLFGVNSTAKLDKMQFDKVQKVFEKNLGQNAELYIPFPSEERMMNEDLLKY